MSERGQSCRCSSGTWSNPRPVSRCSRSAASVGQDGRPRRPARRGDVRRDLRLPARHGPGPQPRDHVVGHRTILFLLIASNKVPSYLGTSASFVAASRRSAPGRRHRRRHRRDPGRRSGAGAGRRPRPLRGRRDDPQGAATGGHRRGGDADRLQPGAGVAGIYWPQDQWVALLTVMFMVVRRGLLPGLLGPDRDLARRCSSATCSRGCSTRSSARSPRSRRRGRGGHARPGRLGRCRGGRLDRPPDRDRWPTVWIVHGPSLR